MDLTRGFSKKMVAQGLYRALSFLRLAVVAEIEFLKRKSDELRMDIMDKERNKIRLQKRADQLELLIRDRVSLMPRGRATDPVIYFITPTAFRPAQRADLTRLSYTLAHVPNLHWIVVEDTLEPSKCVSDVINRSRVKATHLFAKTRTDMKMKYADPNWRLPRGVDQRNAALAWIRTQLSDATTGAVYFGDDDNTYDLRLFDEIRKVKKAGVWPVGIVGGLFVETPKIGANGSIESFNAVWKPERSFPIDMAAFALNLTLVLQNPNAGFSYDVPRGYQESTFLEGLGISRKNMEPLAASCSQVFVWHTRTEKPTLTKEKKKMLERYPKNIEEFLPLEANALGIDLVDP
ncbi:unnamed protein product [Caenorhabditis auriculariae]|uniref:Galactosylgalactosylxylosylprotein 3-beta-glucuronosyltransferase n=1 Tax=Caenorhabditis auriculariae TaxID=2777116 RepID=A0A8S1GSN6_9PELO|nr:unnamed protein product [Caenorhabditis auriculariae]